MPPNVDISVPYFLRGKDSVPVPLLTLASYVKIETLLGKIITY